MAGHLRISSGALPDATRVIAFRGREAMSALYEIEVFMVVPHAVGAEIDLDDAVGGRATLSIEGQKGEPPSRFGGIWAVFELVEDGPDHSIVRGVLVPRLWELGLSTHSRIFTNMSVLEVLKAVLSDAGLRGGDVDFRIANGPAEEHVTQYRESDLAFISRWMEREGIYYFFEQGEHGEKLVLADGPSYPAEEGGRPVSYALGSGILAGAGGLQRFVARHALTAGQVRLRDYDYARPQLELAGSAPVLEQGSAEVSLYGERFFSPADGQRLARVRAEELKCRSVVFHGSGNRRHLRAGHAFTLEHHPRATFNVKYLVVEAYHRGAQDVDAQSALVQRFSLDAETSYAVDIVAIPASAQFRAERRSPWPRIYGYEDGVVEGPGASDYAQIDDQGRYKIKMRFDEGSQKGARASTYVRMMQPHGGGVEGFHFPLRKDTEVVVSFLGGDPDRPVISGVVPNALTPSPVTSGNHTKNVIQTGGHNRLEIEDLAGQQRITLSTPYSNTYLRMGAPNEDHEAILRTDDNALLQADLDYDIRVGQDMDTQVGINSTTTVTSGYCNIDVMTGPYKVHTHANTLDLISNTDFRLESETAYGNIDAHTSLLLQAKNSFGKFVSKTKMTVESTTADVEAKANQAFLVEAKNATGTAKSKGKLLLQSTETDAELHAATGLKIITDGNGIEMSAPADINITSTGAKVNVTSGGAAKFSFFGDQTTINQAASSTYTYGSARSIRLGTDAAYSLTMKTELSAGLSFALKASLALEVSAAMAIKCTAFKAELETMKQTSSALKNAVYGVSLGSAASWLRTHGFTGNVGGIKMEA